jgi:hypothetical protein
MIDTLEADYNRAELDYQASALAEEAADAAGTYDPNGPWSRIAEDAAARQRRALDALVSTPATDADGAAAKGRVLAAILAEEIFEDHADQLAASIEADIKTLAMQSKPIETVSVMRRVPNAFGNFRAVTMTLPRVRFAEDDEQDRPVRSIQKPTRSPPRVAWTHPPRRKWATIARKATHA